MASGIFEGKRRKPGTRSNTKLVVSGGDSPAEHWKVKQDLPKLFDYPYGGVGQTDVIVSKGMMVAIDPNANVTRNYSNDRYVTPITIANGANSVIGMAPFNFCRQVDDRLTGNQPAIITREYVELPYFPNEDDAKNCLWGNVSGNLKHGDLLTVSTDPDLYGRLVKWEEGTHSVSQICAQILAKEPAGSDYDFLEWVMWDERYKKEDDVYINKQGYSAPGMEGYPIDPELYDKNGLGGTQDMLGYLGKYTTQATGVPGITDGENIRNSLLVRNLGVLTSGTKKDTVLSFFVQKDLIRGQVDFKVKGVSVAENDPSLNINYKTGLIKYTVPSDATEDVALTVSYKAYNYGTPTIFDFSGADGVVRLLLKF